MSEATGNLEKSQTPLHGFRSIIAETSTSFSASQKSLASDSSKETWTNAATKVRFRGPDQDDSTYAVICGLRTVLARVLIWFNLPMCWFVGITIATRHIDQWLYDHLARSDPETAIIFAMIYIVYTILAHTVAVFAALGYELWWNPYARAPSLKGEVGREEEVAMVKRNRSIARRIARTLLPCL